MKHDTTKLLQLLKPRGTDEVGNDLLFMMDLFTILEAKFGETESEPGPLKQLAARQRADWRRRLHRQYSVYDYFTGRGPVARRITEAIAILDCFSDGGADAMFEEMGVYAFLSSFQYPLLHDGLMTAHLHALVTEVSEAVFGRRNTITVPVVPIVPSQTAANVPESNYRLVAHAAQRHDHQDLKMLTLVVPFGDVKIMLNLASDGNASLMYYHPKEDIWLASDGEFLFPGMLEALAAEWEKLKATLEIPRQTLALPVAMAALENKVNLVFDNEAKLPPTHRCFLKEPHGSSRLMFRSEDYQLVFMNTRGEYPSRNHYLLKGPDLSFSTRVSLDALSLLSRETLLNEANKSLDALIQEYLGASDVEAPNYGPKP